MMPAIPQPFLRFLLSTLFRRVCGGGRGARRTRIVEGEMARRAALGGDFGWNWHMQAVPVLIGRAVATCCRSSQWCGASIEVWKRRVDSLSTVQRAVTDAKSGKRLPKTNARRLLHNSCKQRNLDFLRTLHQFNALASLASRKLYLFKQYIDIVATSSLNIKTPTLS